VQGHVAASGGTGRRWCASATKGPAGHAAGVELGMDRPGGPNPACAWSTACEPRSSRILARSGSARRRVLPIRQAPDRTLLAGSITSPDREHVGVKPAVLVHRQGHRRSAASTAWAWSRVQRERLVAHHRQPRRYRLRDQRHVGVGGVETPRRPPRRPSGRSSYAGVPGWSCSGRGGAPPAGHHPASSRARPRRRQRCVEETAALLSPQPIRTGRSLSTRTSSGGPPARCDPRPKRTPRRRHPRRIRANW
jgi:hypothetical protein